MNKAQRAELQTEVVDKITRIIEDLELVGDSDYEHLDIQAINATISAAEGVTSAMADQEREKFGNMSEGLQNSESGQKLEEAADKLENLIWPSEVESLDDDTAQVLAAELQEVLTEVEELL